jgi:hypothetical protein
MRQTQFGNLQERFGDWLYYRILTGNALLNRVRRRLGLRYWSLSEFLQAPQPCGRTATSRAIARPDWTPHARAGSTASSAATSIAPRSKCGAGSSMPTTANWVESLTALVEDPDGTLRLVVAHARERWRAFGPRPMASAPAPLDQAA